MPKINVNHLEIHNLAEHPYLFSACIRLFNQHWPKDDENWLAILSQRLNFEGFPQTLLISNSDLSKVVGICCILTNEFAPDIIQPSADNAHTSNHLWVDSLCIDLEFKNSGLGSKFMSLIEDHLSKSRNSKQSNLFLFAQTIKYADFFKKLGYNELNSNNLDDFQIISYDNGYKGSTWVKKI